VDVGHGCRGAQRDLRRWRCVGPAAGDRGQLLQNFRGGGNIQLHLYVTWRYERIGSGEVIRRYLLLAGLAVLALTPARATAQRGVIGGLGRGRTPGNLARDPGVAVPKQVNMINLLLARRTDGAHSDSQFVQVIALKRLLDSTNAPLMRKLDSVERLFRKGAPMFSEPSIARRDSLYEAKAVVRETVAAVHENNTTFRDRAYELLNMQQLTRAREIEAKAEKALLEADKRKP
jgi:hypothetical protein